MARGSVVKQKSGTYRIRVEVDPDPSTGKRRWHTATRRTKREADDYAASVLADVARGTYQQASKETVREYLLHTWLPRYKAQVRPSTYLQRESHVRKHLVPALGGKRLTALRPLDVQTFYADLAERYQPSTVVAIHLTLSTALNAAVRWGAIRRSPAERCRPPKAPRRPASLWTPAQLEQMFAILGGGHETLRAAVATAALTGLRRGELLGLRWEDVDLDAATIRVERTVTLDARGQCVLGPPKTEHARRRLPIAAALVAELRAYRAWQEERAAHYGGRHFTSGWVFVNARGDRLSPHTLRGQWRAAVRRAGLPHIRMHDLRHAAATRMLEAGVPLKVVSEYLGHSTIAVTANTYQHVTEEAARRAAEALDGVLPAVRQ